MLCGESRLLEEQQNDENAFMHYGISTYLVLRFAKIYEDESSNSRSGSRCCRGYWMDGAVD